MTKTFLKTIPILIALFCLFSCQPSYPFEKVEFPTKSFTFNPKADTTLFGEQGTRIFIDSETFQFPNGDLVKDSIKIELQEFYKKSDIVLAELSTESNGELLETAGMLNIKAFSNGKAIEIKSDKRIVVHFPKGNDYYKKMDLFYPDSTATDSSVVNWNVDTISLIKRTMRLSGFGWWYPSSNDSTRYDFIPKDFKEEGYYWNPLDFYVKSYDFSDRTIKEVEQTKNVNTYKGFGSWNSNGVECELYVTKKGYIRSPKIVTNLSRRARREMLKFLRNLPQLEAGKNKYGDIIERRGLLFIKPGDIVPLYETEEAYVKSFNEKYARYEDEPIKSMDQAELKFYIFSVGKLGWINCDRFLQFEEKVDLMVDIKASPDLQLKLVFKDINGVLKPKVVDGKYVFQQIPVGEKATIVGIKNSEDNLLAAIEELTISESPINDLKFSGISLGELRKKIDAL